MTEALKKAFGLKRSQTIAQQNESSSKISPSDTHDNKKKSDDTDAKSDESVSLNSELKDFDPHATGLVPGTPLNIKSVSSPLRIMGHSSKGLNI